MLLYADEVVFTKPARRWVAALGDGATWGGRFLGFPALLSPGAPVFRLAWGVRAENAQRPELEVVLRAVRPLRWLAWLLAIALFGLVPLALAMHWPPSWLLGLLALIYLPTLLAMLWLLRWRTTLGLSGRDIASMGFDVIACPPFALNLIRRVTLRCGLAQSADVFADAVLDPASRARLQRAWEARRALLADGDVQGDAE